MKNKKLLLAILIPSIIFIVSLVVDLLTKYFMFKSLPHASDSKDFLPGFINFVHVENKGAAWGIFAGRPIFLIIVAIVVMALYITFYVLKVKNLNGHNSILFMISVGLIAGGCIGNLVDRIFFGYVRDFINFQFFDFPVFNIADICVSISVVLMFVYFIFIYPKEGEKTQNVQKTDKNIKKLEENSEKNTKKDDFIEEIEKEYIDDGDENER